MLAYTRYLILSLMWRQPGRAIAGAVVLGVVGIVASATVSSLIGRRQGARVLAREGIRLALALLVFCLADWALLWSLPRLRLSFASAAEIMPPLIASILVRQVLFWGLLGATLLAHWRTHRRGAKVQARPAVILFLIVNLGFSAMQLDAYVVEPLLVETTELSLHFDDLNPSAPPVHVVHLTDTHIERNSFREATVIQKVNALHPDMIILTGDYLNLSCLSDPTSAAHFRQFVAQLKAPYGIYAVRGSVEPTLESMARLVEETDVVWLEQEAMTVDVRGQPVTLVGVACSHQQEQDTARLDQAMEGVRGDAFTLLLFHSPDLIREAAVHQVDLYLGGHTHGGQLRLPFYGAVATSSMYGKRYVAGLFEEDGTRMYISRGIGFEGGGMPRARFLCRPEIVSIELAGKE